MTAAPRQKLTLEWNPDLPFVPQTTGKYTITPEMALHWLSRLDNCRPLNQGIVDRYARDMKAGNWPESGETIKWDVDDMCFDGEHRLRACVLAQVPFESWVVTGLPRQAARMVDQGHKRQLNQVLKNAGERYSVALASAATLLWRYERGWADGFADRVAKPSIAELAALIEREPGLRTSTELVHGSFSKAARLARSSTVPTLIHFIGSKTHGELATTFIEQMHSGSGINKGDPAHTLRERLIRLSREKNRVDQKTMLSLWIPPWNAFVKGRQLKNYIPAVLSDPDQLVIL